MISHTIKKSQNYSLLTSLCYQGLTLVGITVSSLILVPQSASAVMLMQINNPMEINRLVNLGWNVEGRAGVSGPGDWEVGVKADDVSRPFEQLDWIWKNGEEVPWRLDWDSMTKTIDFTFGNLSPISYQSSTNLTRFDAFYLWTRATTESGKVERGTSIALRVNKVNQMNVPPLTFSVATAPNRGTNITKKYFKSDTNITSLEGIAQMGWNTLNPQANRARSRVGFKIEGFDPNGNNVNNGNNENTNRDIPESHSVVGLLTASFVFFLTAIRRNN